MLLPFKYGSACFHNELMYSECNLPLVQLAFSDLILKEDLACQHSLTTLLHSSLHKTSNFRIEKCLKACHFAPP